MKDSERPNSGMSSFPLPIRIVVYPSDDDPGYLIAHCLELDVIGMGKTLEGAVLELFENIAEQADACEENATRIYFPAPEWVGERFLYAMRCGRRIPDELMDRVLSRIASDVDRIVATEEVTEDHLLAPA